MREAHDMFLKSILLLSVICLARSQTVPYRYHEKVGIPRAEAIRRSESSGGRVIGGWPVHDSFIVPHTAGIIIDLTTGETSVCAGALVSRTRILTAAQCWFDGSKQAKQFNIVLGSLKLFYGGTRLTSSDVVTHPLWNPSGIVNDIAVVKFNTISFNRNVQAIPLGHMADAGTLPGMTGTLSGYGKNSDDQTGFPRMTALHYVELDIISNPVCQRSSDIPLRASHLCTSGISGEDKVGSCDGDAGGPLTVVMQQRLRTLVGLVTFRLSDACESGYPSVYTRITSHLAWIRSQM